MQRITDTLYRSGRSQRQPQKQLKGLYEQGYAHTFDFEGTGVKRRAIELTISKRRQEDSELNTDFNGRNEGTTAPEAREDVELLFETLTRIPGIPAFILQAGRRKTDVEVLNVGRPAGPSRGVPSSYATNNPSSPAPNGDAAAPRAVASMHEASNGLPSQLPFPFPDTISTAAAVPSRGKVQGPATRRQPTHHLDTGGHPYCRPRPSHYSPPILDEHHDAPVVGFASMDSGVSPNGDNAAQRNVPPAVTSCAAPAAYEQDNHRHVLRSHMGWPTQVGVARQNTGSLWPRPPQAVTVYAHARALETSASHAWVRRLGEGRISDSLGLLDEDKRIMSIARGAGVPPGPYPDYMFAGSVSPLREEHRTQLGPSQPWIPDDERTPSLSPSSSDPGSPYSPDDAALRAAPRENEVRLPIAVTESTLPPGSSFQDGPQVWISTPPQMAHIAFFHQDSSRDVVDRHQTSSLGGSLHRVPAAESKEYSPSTMVQPMADLHWYTSPVSDQGFRTPTSSTVTGSPIITLIGADIEKDVSDIGASSAHPHIPCQSVVYARNAHVSAYSSLEGALSQTPDITTHNNPYFSPASIP